MSSLFDQYVFLPLILDDLGANDTPAQSDLNAFTRADNATGKLAVAWTWDDINSWTGSGQTGDACALFDTDSPSNGNADYAVCVRITNNASGTDVVQLPTNDSPQIWGCSDKKTDRCTNPNTGPLALLTTQCEVVKAAESFPGTGDDLEDVLAACSIDLASIGNASKANILNVCSFPSGAPNSNAFDCVVTPGSGFLQIKKKTTPDQSTKTFSFTLSPAASSGATSFSLTDNNVGDESSALIAVAPGKYSLTEGSIPTGWVLNAASCVLAGSSTGTKSGNAVTGISATIGETTTCTFENIVAAPTLTVDKTANPTSIAETGASVTYTVIVTNTSSLAVTLTTLSDDKFGNLNGEGDCVTGGSIAAGGTYSCSFTKSLAAAKAGDTHTNVVSATVTNAGGSATRTDDATVTYTDVAPTVTVDKSANPTTVQETGGSVTYTVLVTNTSPEAVTLTALSDDKFGNLNGLGTCATGGSIASGGTYTCTFSKSVSGNAGTNHVNTVTATVKDNEDSSVQETDDATVAFTDVVPTLTVDKSASPTSVPETGGSVTYTVLVTNTSSESVTLTTLSDDKFGNLSGRGTCATGGTIAASGGTYSCTFSTSISGNAGQSHINTVTATVTDNDGSTGTDTDDATVTFTDVLPDITTTKTASPTSVAETGGSVTYTVQVKNNGTEAVTLSTLSDDKFGNVSGQGTCATGGSIAASGTYTCTFSKTVSGNVGTSHVNTLTATVQDNDGNSDSDDDDATVSFTNVTPDISVTKTANPTSLSTVVAGTLTFTPDKTFSSNPSPSSGFAFASPTCDDAGPNDQPAQVDLNCFNRADNVAGALGVKWSWDDIDSWTGSGQTGDGCALLDTDNDGYANVAVCARIQNDASGTEIIQIPSAGAADVYVCNDSRSDRCAKQVVKVQNIMSTTCTIAKTTEAFPDAGDDGWDVSATCSIDLDMQGLVNATSLDLLNVCSFPSGEPNSNPFDCVVQIGAGFIQIVKVASPTTTQFFGFTLSPGSTDGSSKYSVKAGVTTAMIPVTPGTKAYSLTETLPSSWTLSDVTCTLDGVTTGTKDSATNSITSFTVKTGQTTICTFTNAGLISGNVTYTITVKNNGSESVSLFSLTDNKFGDLNGVGTCATGGTITGGQTYTCSFTKTLSGSPGTSHTNTVTAVAKDDEDTSGQDTGSATVSFIAPP